MSKQKKMVCNPYLPDWEYVPDGEPHQFGDRIYIYCSHDRFGAPIFCVNDYVCWSSPADDLSDWRYEGVIYRKRQDPSNPLGLRSLYAPDVAQGKDGNFYLYYAFDFLGRIGVARADHPAGPYSFYGYVHFPDGHVWGTRNGEPFPFDPGVLVDDDGQVYLFSGFAPKVPMAASRMHCLKSEGGVVAVLAPDMLTIRKGPDLLFPNNHYRPEDQSMGEDADLKAAVTSLEHPRAFPGHAFFEASSIRKADGRYYFVYSSEHNHDLCYATADQPEGPYTYGGVLVDIGDLDMQARKDESHADNYLGNTHGGLLQIGAQWYIFYHRQTNRSSFARQACAERLTRTPDGGFRQAAVTSSGLHEGPLPGIGTYHASMACMLWARQGTGRYDVPFARFRFAAHPYLTQSGRDREEDGNQYIANMRDGATAGFRYFNFTDSPQWIAAELSGNGTGQLAVYQDRNCTAECARIPVVRGRADDPAAMRILAENGEERRCSLFFRFEGRGHVHFHTFTLSQ